MKAIKVRYRKLGKEKCWGMAHSEGIVEIDSSLKGKKYIEVLVHECLHLLLPTESESSVEKKAIILSNTIWQQGLRRVDNSNDIPLQDGSL